MSCSLAAMLRAGFERYGKIRKRAIDDHVHALDHTRSGNIGRDIGHKAVRVARCLKPQSQPLMSALPNPTC